MIALLEYFVAISVTVCSIRVTVCSIRVVCIQMNMHEQIHFFEYISDQMANGWSDNEGSAVILINY